MLIQQPQLIQRPELSPVLMKSDLLGLVIQSHDGRGLKVFQTVSGGAAETAGLENGDVVIGCEGYYADTMADLENAMQRLGQVELTVKDIRTGRWVNTTMKYGRNGAARIGNPLAYMPNLGCSVEGLFHGGYKVNSIEEGSVAEEIGLTRGDVLRKVNGEKVENAGPDAFRGSFILVYDDAETGYRYTLTRRTWGGRN